MTTPETYLGAARAERFVNPMLSPGSHDFGDPPSPPQDNFAFLGRWKIALDSATAEGGSLELNFGARRVYLVLGSPGHARKVRVQLDGKPIPAAFAGSDVKGGVGRRSPRSGSTTSSTCRAVGNHLLELFPEDGVMGYAFTFG